MVLLATGFDVLDDQLKKQLKDINIFGCVYFETKLIAIIKSDDIKTLILGDFFETGSIVNLVKVIIEIKPDIHIIYIRKNEHNIEALSSFNNVTIMPQTFTAEKLSNVIKDR